MVAGESGNHRLFDITPSGYRNANNLVRYHIRMSDIPKPLDVTFSVPIGITIKGEVWACIEVPDSAELFGTKKGVRVDAEIDGIALPNVALMVTGMGGHMLSTNAKLRKQLGKDVGDTVTVKLLQRLK